MTPSSRQLRRSGRLNVIVVIGPSFSTRKFSVIWSAPFVLLYFGATLRCNSLTFSLFHCFTFLPACAPATDVEQSLFSVSRAERWPSGRRHQIANLAYWVTGTEGSNPSLSATQSVEFTYNLETAANPRGMRCFSHRGAPERASSGRIRS